MDRHPFDPVSLVLGAVFLVAGIIALTGGSIVDDGHFLLPTGLIGLGIAMMAKVRGRDHDRRPHRGDVGESEL